MNKRIKKKIEGKENSIKINEILTEITNNFTLLDKVFGNSYFVFDRGENSVCHFTLKETPDWRYGLWLKDNGGYYIFGEHIELIDKFKPGRCYLDFEDNTTDFITLIEDISLKPKYHFVNSLTYGNAEVDYKEILEEDGTVSYDGYQVVRNYNEETECFDIITRDKRLTQDAYVEREYVKYFKEKSQREAEKESDRTLVFNFFKTTLLNFNDVLAVGVKDMNTKYCTCSPRYTLYIVVNKELSDSEIENLYEKIEDYEEEVNSKKRTSEYDFVISGLYDDLKDIKNCSYKYYNNR